MRSRCIIAVTAISTAECVANLHVTPDWDCTTSLRGGTGCDSPLAGLPLTTNVELPRAVTVLQPTWLVSLHGSQGSLLLAASPCEGSYDSGNLPVTVVVIHDGRSLARRSARGGAEFTFALPPGRYVVRTFAHKRAVAQVKTRRQMLANLTAVCYLRSARGGPPVAVSHVTHTGTRAIWTQDLELEAHVAGGRCVTGARARPSQV